MASPDLLVPAHYYARLGDLLARDGVDFAALVRELRIPQRTFSDPDGVLPFSRVDRLVQRAVEASGRTDLGFDLGSQLAASAHGLVSFGMMSCDTLDQALRFEAQYYRLLVPFFRMRYSGGPDHGEMFLVPRTAMSHACLAFHVEAIGTGALREIRDLIGGRRLPCDLSLSIPEPPHAARYREWRDLRVRFGAEPSPGVRLRLLGDPARYPIAMADAHARRLAEEHCRRTVRQAVDVRGFGDWISMTLREVSGPLPSLADLAAMLHLSKRTLNRYLEREGTSFRELSGRIQHELACERLSAGNASVSEVAYSLGFSDVSNFARAFRSRAGRSPGDHRERTAGRGRARRGAR